MARPKSESPKTSKIEFKIEPASIESYKSLCKSKGIDLSKRLRLFIEFELSYDSKDIDIIKILEKNNIKI